MKKKKLDAKVMARVRVQKYRAKHRRIDYVPSPEVLIVIERHLESGLNNCLAGTIDDLIEAGDKAITGNAQR